MPEVSTIQYERLKAIAEGLLFLSGEPLPLARLAEVLGITVPETRQVIESLKRDYETLPRGMMLREVAGGFQLVSRPEYAEYYVKLSPGAEKGRLSQAALETLAIIVYRQPVTRMEVEAIRGVKCEKAIATLIERRLVKEVGRAEGVGRPILYGTTDEFLKYFGLKSLDDLPPVENFG